MTTTDPAITQQRADAAFTTVQFAAQQGDAPCQCTPRPLRLHVAEGRAAVIHEHHRQCAYLHRLSSVLGELDLELVTD